MQALPIEQEEICRRGEIIYHQDLQKDVETEENMGKVLVLDVDSKDFEIDSDQVTASRRLRERHPASRRYALRIGYPSLYKVAGRGRRLAVTVSVSLLLLFLLVGCSRGKTEFAQFATLTEARRSFHSNVLPSGAPKEPVKPAPANSYLLTIGYPAPAGELAAYLSRDPGDGAKHPAIIWITGGDCNSIGDVWTYEGPQNDQTAMSYRMMGIVTMFPSLRGGNTNPGTKEGFLGEADDVLAAADYLEKLPYVDPKRIYLGGHSTGGTLALLVAESSTRFRGVFSFGPIDDVANYGPDTSITPIDINNRKEVEIRSPIYWLSSIKTPVWVFEGTNGGNIGPLRAMKQATTNPNVHFIPISGADHFSTLAPTNELIAKKILSDTGETSSLSFSEDEANRFFKR